MTREAASSTTTTEGADWASVLARETSHETYIESVDGEEAVTVRLNRGDHRENGVVIGPDGLTDRVVAMEVCFALEGAGVTTVRVLDPLDGELAYRSDRCRLS